MVLTNLNNVDLSDVNIRRKISAKLGWNEDNFTGFIFNPKDELKYCYEIANTSSHDPTTQVGACIVDSYANIVSIGYNGFIQTPLTLDVNILRESPNAQKPMKYSWFEHAERRAIFDAMRSRGNLSSCVMVCPYFSCADCSRAICLSGIKLVVGHKIPLSNYPSRWQESIEIGRKIFDQYGVMYYEYENPVGSTMMMDGKTLIV